MMKTRFYKKSFFPVALFACCLIVTGTILPGCIYRPKDTVEIYSDATIFPEYYNLTVPPNIAPLNFIIREPGSKFSVEISGADSKPILIRQKSPEIRILQKAWKELLKDNAGNKIYVKIKVFKEGVWKKFPVIEHAVAHEPIDSHLVYRLVHAVYLKWRDMGIYQRNLTSFEESTLIENSSTGHGCMNCHTFSGNNPSRMLVHFRILHQGTLIWNEGNLSKTDTKTPATISAGVYPSWHPDGKYIAFSAGKLIPHLTTRLEKTVDVSDSASDIFVYDTEKNEVYVPPALSTDRRENMPVWSPDGKFLYYIEAPAATQGDTESRLHQKYSLKRIAFEPELCVWGEPEMVLSSEETGMSISMPSISPDGKFVVCSMTDYGYFTIFHKQSDLYLVNTGSGEFKKLELNSESTESHSCWSSNGRWLVFSSKRTDDVFTRPFIAYIDSNGVAHKPFLLPQKDPDIYNRLQANYNLPELVTGKVELSPFDIRDVVLKEAQPVVFNE